jgi:very-short-patch-repair endonuclease
VRQKTIGPYVADFCCYGKKLVVELDGGQHDQQIERDARRTVFLHEEGYRVIRFSDTDALKNTMAVLEQIRRALDEHHSSPSPQPSPASVGGGNS